MCVAKSPVGEPFLADIFYSVHDFDPKSPIATGGPYGFGGPRDFKTFKLRHNLELLKALLRPGRL